MSCKISNEALNLTKRRDIMGKVEVDLEAFTDDILNAIGERDFFINYKIPEKNPNKIIFTWRWERIAKTQSKEFTLSVTDTAECFINRIKAYLFDMVVTIINI